MEKRKQKGLKKVIYTTVIAFLILILLFISYSNSKMGELPSFKDSITVFVLKNSSVSTIVKQFNKYKLLEPSWFFTNYIKIKMKLEGKSIYAGNYDVKTYNSNEDIIGKLFTGGYAKTISVTVPEGLNDEEIAKIFSARLNLNYDKFLQLTKSDSLLKAWGINSNSLIGYLMPNTYEFYGDESEQAVIDKLLKYHFDFWTKEREDKLKKMNLTKNEFLTLASIVQAETPLKSELPIVAGLYLNRLRKGMLLQADPTVQFAIGSKKRLLTKDLEINSPYNTYKYVGLPPGPINNPGEVAMEACLNPAKNQYLYMVAVGDSSGAHNFATNIRDHNKNVLKYKINRKKY